MILHNFFSQLLHDQDIGRTHTCGGEWVLLKGVNGSWLYESYVKFVVNEFWLCESYVKVV